MTRLFTDGAEMGDTRFWDIIPSPSGPSITAVQTPTPVGGEWCYRGCWGNGTKLIGADLTEFYLRYRLRGLSPGLTSIGWCHVGDPYGAFSQDGLNRFCVYVGDNIVATSNVAMQADTWYLIELHVKIDNAVGRIEAFVDGDQLIDFTGDTNPTAGDNHVDNLRWSTGAYVSNFLDDLALNDTNGLTDNSWCGDGMIVKMIPNGNGTHNNWTNSDEDSVNNYLYVDEYPNDGDLTYVYADGSSAGLQDQYTLSDLDYTNRTVLRIWPEARARESAPSGYILKLGILPSGGSDDLSAGRTLFSGYYSRIVGEEYTVNPVDSSPWEEADLDSLQFIAEVG